MIIDPVLLQIGPITLYWYGFMYSLSLGISGLILYRPVRLAFNWSGDTYITLLLSIMIGIISGGRIGYISLYGWDYYSAHWLAILSLTQGGMSYHGGLVGAGIATAYVSYKQRVSVLALTDYLVFGACIGLFFGRIGNFINGELYGHVTSMPWGVRIPGAGDSLRHPVQLYASVVEGGCVGALLLSCRRYLTRPGQCTALYLIAASVARFGIEYFRVPDAGLIFNSLTRGQGLSLVLFISGIVLLYKTSRTA